MNEDTGRKLLLSTFLLAIALLTWNEIHVQKKLPRPQRYVGAGVIWCLLGLLSPVLTYPVAGAFSVAMVLVLMYQVANAKALGNVENAIGQGAGQFLGSGGDAASLGSAGGGAARNIAGQG